MRDMFGQALRDMGGIYMDLDVITLRPFTPLMVSPYSSRRQGVYFGGFGLERWGFQHRLRSLPWGFRLLGCGFRFRGQRGGLRVEG